MNWEKIKNDITKEKSSSYYHVTGSEYFGRWATAKKNGWLAPDHKNISQFGYEIYLTILTVIGKESIWGSPKRTQKMTKHVDYLIEHELIVYDEKTKKFIFTNRMPGFFAVLVLAIDGKAIPKINH